MEKVLTMSSKSAVSSVNSHKFKEILMESSPNYWILVDFYASWCGPCKKIAPQIKELAKKYPHVTFLKVDIERCPELARDYYINSLPTFMLFTKGSLVSDVAPVLGASISRVENLIRSNCQDM